MRNQIIESVLNKYPEVEWEYKSNLPLKDIDRDKSHKNQARVMGKPVKPFTVEDYANGMKQGDEFPAIVAYPDGKLYVVIDGNHRVDAALKNGLTTFDAYIVVTDDPNLRMLLTFEFNRVMTGLSPDEADIDHQAVFLFHQGIEKQEISTHLRIPIHRIDTLIRDQAGRVRAERLTVERAYQSIPARESRNTLSRLRQDPVFIEAIKLSAKYALTIAEVRELVTGTLALGSEASQLAFVEGFGSVRQQQKRDAEALASTGKPRRKGNNNPRQMFKAHVGYLIKFDPSQTFVGLDASERAGWKVEIESAIQSLQNALTFVKK